MNVVCSKSAVRLLCSLIGSMIIAVVVSVAVAVAVAVLTGSTTRAVAGDLINSTMLAVAVLVVSSEVVTEKEKV